MRWSVLLGLSVIAVGCTNHAHRTVSRVVIAPTPEGPVLVEQAGSPAADRLLRRVAQLAPPVMPSNPIQQCHLGTTIAITIGPHTYRYGPCEWPPAIEQIRAALVSAAHEANAPARSAFGATWRAVLNDWYDGRMNQWHSCGAVREAMRHLPSSTPTYSTIGIDLNAYARGVCATRNISTARTTTPASRPISLRWLQMVDTRRGYAESGEGDTFRVLRTGDGGHTWVDITPGGGTYRATSPVTIHGNTLLFSTRIRGGRFAVERSDDGGRAWRQSLPFRDPRGSPAAGQPFALDSTHLYLAVNEGAAAGSSGQALYASSDGGHRWQFVSATQTSSNPNAPQLPFGCDKDGFGFASLTRGFAGGYCAGGIPFFYRTDDGGRTWHRQHLAEVPTQCACETTAPIFSSPTVGVLSVYGYPANGSPSAKPFLRILWTHDGGNHWTGSSPPGGRASRPAIVNPDVVWLTGQAPGAIRSPFNRLILTSDGGKHWRSEKLPFDGQSYLLDPVDRQTAFALNIVTGGHTILVTRDGGRSWRARTPRLRG